MALTSVRSNKMRSLLTMLGIIIGIAAVIAIETVGNSMTGSVMDSMSGMGASNISVTVTQKSSSDTSGTSQASSCAGLWIPNRRTQTYHRCDDKRFYSRFPDPGPSHRTDPAGGQRHDCQIR